MALELKNSIKCCFLSLLVVFISCEPLDSFEVNNLNNNSIGVIGHGGGGFLSPSNPIPENSAESIRRAIMGLGVDGVEVDVQMSKDYELFLYHDEYLDSKTSCQGFVSYYNSDQLKECKYRLHLFANLFTKDYLAQLDDVLFEYKNLDPKPYFFLDCRTTFSGFQQPYDSLLTIFAQKINETVVRNNAQNWIFVISGNNFFMRKMKQINSSIYTVYDAELTLKNLDTALSLGASGIVSDYQNSNRSLVERAHQAGLYVSLFNLKSREAHIEAIEDQVDFIQTDNIEMLQSILNRVD